MNARKFRSGVVVLAVVAVPGAAIAQTPVGTAFTYHGQLKEGGVRVNDTVDFEFTLFDDATTPPGAQIGSTVTTNGVDVVNGLFILRLDFGASAVTGDARWLEIEVKGSGDGGFTTLAPRQELTPTPHALALPGLWTQQNATSPNLIGGYSGNSTTNGVYGATVGGGGQSGEPNRVTAEFGTVSGGYANVASGAGAAVGGGRANEASEPRATIGGGYGNVSSNAYATVGGGFGNIASGNSATVAGGLNNQATEVRATIGGGRDNTVSGGSATIGGGSGNIASDNFATVGGGDGNQAGDDDADPENAMHATVGGGLNNTASDFKSTVSGGSSNTASASHSTVGGGFDNTASDQYATVGGGSSNEATGGSYATVGGGYNNVSSNSYATVSGGSGNVASGDRATVGGGSSNTASASHSTVGGGFDNTADESYATVGGGYNNVSSNSYATVSGGRINTASGQYATVGGGWANTASEQYATVGGGWVNTASEQYATVGGGWVNTASSWGTTVGGGEWNRAIGVVSTIAGGWSNTARGSAATVGGGAANEAGGDYSFAAGHNAIVRNAAASGDSDGDEGSFVWADSNDLYFPSATEAYITPGPNQFLARATGGAVFVTAIDGPGNSTETVEFTTSGGIVASGTIESTGGGFKFPDTTVQTTAANADGHSLDAADGTPVDAVFVDNDGNVGIGTTTPTSILHIVREVSSALLDVQTFRNTSLGSVILGRHARGTESSPSAVLDDDILLSLQGGGYDGTAFDVDGAKIDIRPSENWAASAHGTRIWFWTTPNGSTSPFARMMIDNDGKIAIARGSTSHPLHVGTGGSNGNGAHLTAGGTWTNGSDRNSKQDFTSVDNRAILRKVIDLPVTQWQYKGEDEEIRHIGPVAQDFYAAFGLGHDEKYITTIDADGVALAAIQGLHEIVLEKDSEIDKLREQNSKLEVRLAKLERLVLESTSAPKGGAQ